MKLPIILLAILALSGCGNSRFDCPYSQGPSCLSMEQIDKNIKSGKKSGCSKTEKCASIAQKNVDVIESANPAPAKRMPEEVLQMWVAPHESSDGIFYQASFVNVIVKDASWIGPKIVDAN